jgi:hypothetical protein
MQCNVKGQRWVAEGARASLGPRTFKHSSLTVGVLDAQSLPVGPTASSIILWADKGCADRDVQGCRVQAQGSQPGNLH